MDNIKTLLEQEIEAEFEALGNKEEVGTKEYQVAVDNVGKLLDRAIEIQKFEAEREDKLKAQEEELKLKQQQAEDEKKDKIVRNGIAIGGIIIPSVITVWGTLKSLKFEETGTVTTMMGRGFIQKLLPKK